MNCLNEPLLAEKEEEPAIATASVALRLTALDAARGMAMLLVCLAHFSQYYLSLNAFPGTLIFPLCMLATPSFMLISGALTGYIHSCNPAQFFKFEKLLLSRGIFLLTVGHISISLAHIYRSANILDAFRWIFVTDAIGFAIIAGPPIVRKVSSGKRLLLSLALLIISWWCTVAFYPTTPLQHAVKELLWGSYENTFFELSFPFFSWLAFYLASSLVGEYIASCQRQDESLSSLPSRLMTVGCVIFCIGAALKILDFIAIRLSILPAQGVMWKLTSPFQKDPPGLTYILVYGGASVVMIGAMFFIERARLLVRLVAHLQMFGQTSLFLFIAQYYVYYTFVPFFHTKSLPGGWPLHFLVSILLLSSMAAFWQKQNLNRYLKVRWFVR